MNHLATAMSPDLNPIEHMWDMLGRRIHAREPPVQNIHQLEAALHREWQQLSQQDILISRTQWWPVRTLHWL
jgi:transposase